MARIAASSMFFNEYPTDLIFDFAEEAGLDGIEFWMETPHFWLRQLPVDELLEVAASHPDLLPITMHGPVFDLNPCSINPGVAAVSIHYTLLAITIASQLDASVITLHPGKRTVRRPPSRPEYLRFEYYLDQIRDKARNTRTRVALENMEESISSLLCTPEEVAELLEKEPWLYFTLDIAHALVKSPAEVERYLERTISRLANVHVSGYRGGKIHLPVAGDPEVGAILSLLAEYGYDGYLTLEIEDRNFTHDLGSEEKITLLSREVDYLEKYLNKR
jgi:sugar phosphate isomerase/epimerase